ncbi:MAG: GTPase Era, partial [Clostridia bacterium]|nr:GTPase Era [Clostridia bacterium]
MTKLNITREQFKCGFVTILGETNAGKSTLINQLVGEHVAIVSPKSQTTRENIQGIYNDENSQIVFVDTPGYHKTEHKLDEYMQENIDTAINSDVNVLIYVIDGKKPLIEQYEKLANKGDKRSKKILVINKIDDTTFEKLYPQLAKLNEVCKVDEILPLSALTGKNVDVLINMIKKYLPTYDYEMRYYPVEQFTDKNVRFLASEIIREKVLLLYNEEIPHGVAVQITQFDESDEDMIRISADIYCERDSHKMILIGKNGEAIKKLSTIARVSIEKMLDAKVYLDLFVKVKPNWRADNLILDEFGYTNKD